MKPITLLAIVIGALSFGNANFIHAAEDTDDTEQQIEEKINECENKESKRQVIACLSWILANYRPFFGSAHGMMMDLINRRIRELTRELRE